MLHNEDVELCQAVKQKKYCTHLSACRTENKEHRRRQMADGASLAKPNLAAATRSTVEPTSVHIVLT